MLKTEAKFRITGKVVEVGEIQTFSSGFTKREVIIETSSKAEYPSPTAVTFKKSDCSLPDRMHVGDWYTVEGFVDGREYNGRHYVDLVGRNIFAVSEQETKTAATATPTQAKPRPVRLESEFEDVPF